MGVALSAPYPHPFKFGFEHHPDALRAFDYQRERAVFDGQHWTDAHANAFRELQQAYVLTGLGMTHGRTAWPLAVGTGKTQSVIAFVKAQADRLRSGLPPLSVLVCMERVAQLGKLYRDMVKADVSTDLVGVFHHKASKEVREENLPVSIPASAIGDYPFLLATHEMLMTGQRGIDTVNRYQGRDRNLVIWDESLQKARSTHADLTLLSASLAVFSSYVASLDDSHRDAHDAHRFLQARLGALRGEFDAQLSGAAPSLIEPAVFAEGDATRFLAGLSAVLSGGSNELREAAHRDLAGFLRCCSRPSRVLPYVNAGQKVGVIQFEMLIPSSLRRLIILDASHNVRLLMSEHDQDVQATRVDCAVKRFDHVRVRHLRHGAGRGVIEAETQKWRTSSLVREVVDAVRNIPADESVLIVTFKQKPADKKRGKTSAVEGLQLAMKAAGIDTEAKLPGGDNNRLTFITWGQHIGDSHHSHCKHVICVGMLRRNPLDLSAAIAGQRVDLLSTHAADAREVERVEHSEVFHHLIQAAGRGACRNTANGQAGEMTLSFICPHDFPAEWWAMAMPGAHLEEWTPVHARRSTQQSETAKALATALRKVPERDNYISSKTLKALAGLQAVNPNRFSEAIRSLVKAGIEGWTYVKERRGFVRCPFATRSEVQMRVPCVA